MPSSPSPKESLLLKFALGAALAAGAGYAYFTHKEDIDAEAKKRIQQLAKAFHQSKTEVEKRVKKAWGEVSHEAVASYLDVRANLLHALEKEPLKKGEKMLKERYEKLVDSVLLQAKKTGILNGKNQQHLSEVLKSDWQQVQKVMSLSLRAAENNARSTIKNAQKSARKTLKSAQGTAKKLGANATKKAGSATQKARTAVKNFFEKSDVKKAVKKVQKAEEKASKVVKSLKKSAKKRLSR